MNDSPSHRLTQQLLAYWIKNPDAQGTVESIVEWWLLEQRIEQAAAEIRSVLVELVVKKFVRVSQQADERIFYGLNRAKEAEIRVWLGSGGADRPLPTADPRRQEQ